MLKKSTILILFAFMALSSGCQTVKGMGQDVQNISNPDANGWNSLQKADSWVQENLW